MAGCPRRAVTWSCRLELPVCTGTIGCTRASTSTPLGCRSAVLAISAATAFAGALGAAAYRVPASMQVGAKEQERLYNGGSIASSPVTTESKPSWLNVHCPPHLHRHWFPHHLTLANFPVSLQVGAARPLTYLSIAVLGPNQGNAFSLPGSHHPLWRSKLRQILQVH